MNNYSIRELATLSGISSRALRHYDQIGLLRPLYKNEAGYRIYGPKEVDRLQQILLYKASGLPLKTIKQVLTDPSFGVAAALKEQKHLLLKHKKQLEGIINTIDQSIKARLGETVMTDDQKFQNLKNQIIEENDQKFGKEVKERWGEEAFKKSNQQFENMSQEQFDRMNQLDQEFKEALKVAFAVGDPGSVEAQKAVNLHRQWLLIFWDSCSLDAHLGLAEMYVADERFHHYFGDNLQMAEFFRDAVKHQAK